MVLDQFTHGLHLLCNLHVDEANNARMRQAMHKHEFTEVLVFGDEHPLLLVRQCKQRLISSLRIYLKGRKDIVSQVGQQRMQTAGRSTGVVEQKSHRGLSDRDAIIHLLTDQ